MKPERGEGWPWAQREGERRERREIQVAKDEKRGEE